MVMLPQTGLANKLSSQTSRQLIICASSATKGCNVYFWLVRKMQKLEIWRRAPSSPARTKLAQPFGSYQQPEVIALECSLYHCHWFSNQVKTIKALLFLSIKGFCSRTSHKKKSRENLSHSLLWHIIAVIQLCSRFEHCSIKNQLPPCNFIYILIYSVFGYKPGEHFRLD